MGFFDSVKAKYDALAADANKAGKVTAAQARLVVLQNDLRRAERDLGKAAFALVESGEISHPRLATVTSRMREAQDALREKEAEIAVLRGGVPDGTPRAPDDDADSGAVMTEAVDEETGAVTAAEVVEESSAGRPPAAAEAGTEAEAAGTATRRPPVKRTPAKKTAGAKTAAASGAAQPGGKKAPAKKAGGAKKTTAKKPPADATPASGDGGD